MKPTSAGERLIAVFAAIAISTGIVGGLASLAVHQRDGRSDVATRLARAGIGCEPVRIAQPEAVAVARLAARG